MQTVCKKVMLSHGDLVRRVLASGCQAASMVGDTRPVRLMDRMLNMYGVINDDSDGVWADLSSMRQCVQCGSLHERTGENTTSAFGGETTNMPVADCCGLVHYCDRECQGDHAAYHKPRCRGRFFKCKESYNYSSLTERDISKLIVRDAQTNPFQTADDIYYMSDSDCKARREIKIAHVCACALNYMQKLSMLNILIPPVNSVQRKLQLDYYSKFPKWWQRHKLTQTLELDELRVRPTNLLFVATFNDRLGCLCFMQLTPEESFYLFNEDERQQLQATLFENQNQMDKTQRAVLAVAFKDHGSRKCHFRILPLYIPNNIEAMQLSLCHFRHGAKFASMPDHVRHGHRWVNGE